MVFKGFTDENGNVIPVQGAGTVYNEEKNSLALGKDTSAIGYDQFVFGRGNVENSDKVEIVGGGMGVMFELLQRINIGYEFPYEIPNFSDGVRLFKKWGNTLAEARANTAISYKPSKTILNIDLGIVVEQGQPSISINESDIAFVLCEYLPPEVVIGGLERMHIICKDGFWYKTEGVINHEGGRANEITFQKFNKLHNIKNVTNLKNIRTLDWEGTQWNAGDITCDDGNGNTISMRDLLSRIAALEAAVN